MTPSIAASRAPARIVSSASKSFASIRLERSKRAGIEPLHEALQTLAALGEGERAQILRAIEQDVVEADEGGIVAEHLGRDGLAPEPLLERVEAGRLPALGFALHQQLAVEHALRREGFGDIGEAPGDVVAGAAVEPGFAAGMDELDADPVPLPFGQIVVQRDPRFLERMGEHEGAEDRHVLGGRLRAAALRPIEDRRVRRADAVPDLLDRIDVEFERIGERDLGEARGDTDP